MVKEEFNKDTGVFCLFRIPNEGARAIWEVTNRCNYRCPYCIANASVQSNFQELETQQAISLISELKASGFTHLKITGGEPFTRPDMLILLEHAVNQGLKVDISTNASLITEESAQKIAGLKLEMVHVSLDGASQEIQEAARGKGTYAPTIRGIKNLVAAGTRYIRIGSLIFKGNEDKLPEVAAFCKELGVNEVIFSLMEAAGRGREIGNLITAKKADVFKKILSEIKIEGLKISGCFSEKTQNSQASLCPGGDKFLFINSRGQVSPCTWLADKLPEYVYEGNLRQSSLKEILANACFPRISRALFQCSCNYCPAQKPEVVRELRTLADMMDKTPEQRFAPNSPAYLFSTENLSGTLAQIDVRDKAVLTVGASGDQLFNLVLNGASQVDCFDLNLYARYILEYKKNALKTLSREEFFNLNSENYLKVRNKLSLPCRYLFDQALSSKECREKTIKEIYIEKSKIKRNNPYLNSEQNFQSLREKSLNYNFIITDVRDLSAKLSRNYDLIYLSNIIDYAHFMFEGDYLEQFKTAVLVPLLKFLNPGGRIISYIYDYNDQNKSSARSRVNIGSARRQAFSAVSGCVYEEQVIDSAVEDDNKDALLILRKKES